MIIIASNYFIIELVYNELSQKEKSIRKNKCSKLKKKKKKERKKERNLIFLAFF